MTSGSDDGGRGKEDGVGDGDVPFSSSANSHSFLSSAKSDNNSVKNRQYQNRYRVSS